MPISVFDLFTIGIGPSSSHTVGPMKAAKKFINKLAANGQLDFTKRINIELFGSLAFTGKGHGTDNAILLGLEGNAPNQINPDVIKPRAAEIIESNRIRLNGNHEISFDYLNDFIFNFKDLLPLHTNGMRFSAYDANQAELRSNIYYSIGGGFILDESESSAVHEKNKNINDIPYPFSSAKTLLELCEKIISALKI